MAKKVSIVLKTKTKNNKIKNIPNNPLLHWDMNI